MKTKLFLCCAAMLLIAALPYLTGCATHTAALDRARATYDQVNTDPTVQANAPTTLDEARQDLDKAEKADHKSEQEHYAYLAEKKSEQARYEANQKTAEQNITRLGQERDQVLLERRERDAAQARTQAQLAEQQADQAEQRARIAQQEQARAQGQAQVAEQQAQLQRQQSDQLEKQLSDLKAQQTNQGNVMLTMPDVMFATNQATLTPGAMLSIDKLADILKQNPNETVYIEGHTDNTGSAEYNRRLSAERADAVRDALIQRGVSADRIMAQGFGESFPVTSNDTQAGRQMNRRVDIVITGNARALTTPTR